MPSETSFAKIKYALAADEVRPFPAEVSEPGAKTIDKFLEEHTLTIKARAASYEAKSGELGGCSKAITVTLPNAAASNQLIGVLNISPELVGVTGSGGAKIYGDFILLEATIKLAQYQHVILQSDGGNWAIIAGEPKREQAYSISAERALATPFTPSASRPTQVILWVKGEAGINVYVGGVQVTIIMPESLALGQGFSFICPPGVAWEVTKAFGAPIVKSSYLTL